MKYPYFRGLEADRYSFYRVPKALIKVDLFEKMSGDAKLLYAVLLDRMNLSLKNGWQDENGNAYIIRIRDILQTLFSGSIGVMAVQWKSCIRHGRTKAGSFCTTN